MQWCDWIFYVFASSERSPVTCFCRLFPSDLFCKGLELPLSGQLRGRCRVRKMLGGAAQAFSRMVRYIFVVKMSKGGIPGCSFLQIGIKIWVKPQFYCVLCLGKCVSLGLIRSPCCTPGCALSVHRQVCVRASRCREGQ